MAYTARTLITRAYYLSQIVARGLQTVSGEQISDGLFLLNALLSFKGSDIRLIPYFRRYEFDTVAGTEEYFIEDLLYVDSLTFNLNTVRFSLIETTRREYFASPRVDNIQSLPNQYRVEREKDGSRIYLYFVPSQVFTMKLSGKFGLTEVTLDEDLQDTYDNFYIEYLRYALAEYICSDFGVTFPDESKAKYMEIQKKLMEVSPADLSLEKKSYFSGAPAMDWQMIALYKGWVPF